MTPTPGTRPVSSVWLATNWRLLTVGNQTHPDSSFDRQKFMHGQLSICFSSCIFHSCIFHHCYLLLFFPLLHIPPVRSTPASSTPAISTSAIFSCSFHSCIFHSRIFSAPLCPSIRLNVTNRSSIKTAKHIIGNQCRMIAKGLSSFLTPTILVKCQWVTPKGAAHKRGVGKVFDFRRITHYISTRSSAIIFLPCFV